MLLKKGCSPNVFAGTPHWTPLIYAAARDNVDCVKLLLKHNAKVCPPCKSAWFII